MKGSVVVTIMRWTGTEARILRETALRMSIRDFAAHTHLSPYAIRDFEAKGAKANLRSATQKILDDALAAAPEEAKRRFAAGVGPAALRRDCAEPADGVACAPRPPHVLRAATDLTARSGEQLPPLDPQILHDAVPQSQQTLVVTGGRVFTGSKISAHFYPAVDDGRIVATVPEDNSHDRQQGWPGRELVVGVVGKDSHVDAYGIDRRHVDRRLAGAEGRLPIPTAYRLDDLTVGLLWAVTNIDTSLLGDDAQLAACRRWISQYEAMPRSSASRDAVTGLSRVSQMWLGSDFCARHILRRCGTLAGLPAFWTREQYGEEASAWLLFTHKYDYLQQLADRYSNHVDPVTRTFSITEAAVAASLPHERVLLMLAVALMESFGIQVNVCVDAAYRALEGFVLDRQRCTIVANWVDTDAIWHVDVSSDQPDLRRHADALDYGQAHSAIAATTSRGRLKALAGLLDLNWGWLARRCCELAEYGSAGLVGPHSRLLSTAGVDRACGYLAAVAERNG